MGFVGVVFGAIWSARGQRTAMREARSDERLATHEAREDDRRTAAAIRQEERRAEAYLDFQISLDRFWRLADEYLRYGRRKAPEPDKETEAQILRGSAAMALFGSESIRQLSVEVTRASTSLAAGMNSGADVTAQFLEFTRLKQAIQDAMNDDLAPNMK